MSISCGCAFYDPSDFDEWYYYPDDFTIYTKKRACKCSSCKKKIINGDTIIEIAHIRKPLTDVEYKICGDEVPLAPKRTRAKCGEIFMALVAYGYCVDVDENMALSLKEHWENSGYEPINKEFGLAAEGKQK